MVSTYSETERREMGGKLLVGSAIAGALAYLWRSTRPAGPPVGTTIIPPGTVGGPGQVPAGSVVTFPSSDPGNSGSPVVVGPLPGAGVACPAPGSTMGPQLSGTLSVSEAVAGPNDSIQVWLNGTSDGVDQVDIWAGGSPSPSIVPQATAYRRIAHDRKSAAGVASVSTFPGAGAIFIFGILYQGGVPIVTGMPSVPGFLPSLVQIVAVGSAARTPAGSGGGSRGGLGAVIPVIGGGRSGGITVPTFPAPTNPQPPAQQPPAVTADLGWPNVVINGVPYVFSRADRVNQAIIFRQRDGTATVSYGPGTLPSELRSYLAYFQ